MSIFFVHYKENLLFKLLHWIYPVKLAKSRQYQEATGMTWPSLEKHKHILHFHVSKKAFQLDKKNHTANSLHNTQRLSFLLSILLVILNPQYPICGIWIFWWYLLAFFFFKYYVILKTLVEHIYRKTKLKKEHRWNTL